MGRSLCSRNARPQKTLVGRAQLGSSHPPLSERSIIEALLDNRFEYPAQHSALLPHCVADVEIL
jgi:hypothetical protein